MPSAAPPLPGWPPPGAPVAGPPPAMPLPMPPAAQPLGSSPSTPQVRQSYAAPSYDITAATSYDKMVRRIIWIALLLIVIAAVVIATRLTG